MLFLLKLVLSLAVVYWSAKGTKAQILQFAQPKSSVLSFFGANAFASLGWFWAYLVGELLITGHFTQNENVAYIAAGSVIAGFITSCLTLYVLFYKDMPKGPTR